MAWRIEQAKTDRSSCRQCGKRIPKGEHRFGNDELNAFWYHLACAPEAKPRAFKPFAKEAAALMANAPPAATQPAPTAGHDNLVARLRANPTDEAARGVYADWLQSQGNPLGELIALELAGKPVDAKKHFKKHAAAITGGFATRMFEFREGFVDRIQMEVSRRPNKDTLAQVLELPAAVIVREMSIPSKLDAAFVEVLNKVAPPTLIELFTWFTNGVAGLAMPNLRNLRLYKNREDVLDVPALAPLLEAKGLPAVRHLAIINSPIPGDFLRAFLDSPLLRQLEGLELRQNALDAAGTVLVAERRDAIAHLKVVDIAGID
jgi:uncharacterized protein (TIGR02996 family)